MARMIAFLYGAVAYALFLITFVYAIGFISGLPVPKTIDSGPVGPLSEALVVNILLLGLFAVQHSVMARKGFKRWWTQIVSPAVERSTFVLFATLALMLLLWQWQPIPTIIWEVDDPTMAMALTGLSLFGWVIVLASTFMINHFELFGLHQVVKPSLGPAHGRGALQHCGDRHVCGRHRDVPAALSLDCAQPRPQTGRYALAFSKACAVKPRLRRT
jgi:protein-S-isoprenylcysteine O-methyltransferase Ste14